jgi:hypothetical protein
MRRKLVLIIFVAVAWFTGSCVKETYDMDRLSKRAHFSPTLGISAARGEISFSDLVEPDDTVIFDEDNFVRLVFREDSVIEFALEDLYDLDNMVSFSESYEIGPMRINPFQGSQVYLLGEIIQSFTNPTLRDQFIALDGTNANFPPFPVTNIPARNLAPFANFEYALFETGSIDIQVTNNLPAPIHGASVKIYNTSGYVLIGQGNISSLEPGLTAVTSIDISGKTVRNQLTVEVTLNGSPGTSVPVLIDLDVNKIDIMVTGRDMKVTSGRIILPDDLNFEVDEYDTVSFDPGDDIEMTEFKITTGYLSYTLNSQTPATASVNIELPTIKRDGTPVTRVITVAPYSVLTDSINIDNTNGWLNTDPVAPFNRVPFRYSIDVGSNSNMVTFNSTDKVQLDFELHNPAFDFVKGYFGQETETIDPDTLDLDIDEVLDKISGSFLISNPSIAVRYSNSFAIPVRLDLQATGYKGAEIVNLGLSPVTLSYPAAPAERDKEDIFSVNRNNSALPQLVSMPPERMRFAGSAMMNPLGNNGSRDNYIFNDSRFIGSLEIEVPLEFRMNNLQFTDTVDNFFKEENPDSDNPMNPEDFEFLRVEIDAENGFPLGISLSMILYDSTTKVNKCTITADQIIKPAPVDANGRVTTAASGTTLIDIKRDFWDSINDADKIIFSFTLNTTDAGSKDVKIYSDYKIIFNAALVLKPDIKFDLK